ncbi:MAG: hypothetical protein NC037_02085 [Bacteroides sp.]|nr:hypothetical protein [Bacillota bacterium]MCM1393462.1 hypothetical protein [[Eubacterium] siraeum]MCM1455304.1 hypothetical protein [Bacteroides sp.]
MKRRNIFSVIFAVVAIAISIAAIFDFDGAERKLCDAANVYDMLTPELVEAYEREIAGESVVSDKTQSQLERSAARLGVEVNKLKALMMLQDLASKTGKDVSLNDLAAMSEIKLLGYFKQCVDDYMSSVPEERKEEIKKIVSDTLKIPVKF